MRQPPDRRSAAAAAAAADAIAPPAQGPRGCTNLKIRQLARLVGRHYEAHAAATGLKNTQYSLLSHVVKLGPLRPRELAQAMRLDASTLTRNLQPLVAQGWVEIGPGQDGRSRLIAATDAGHAVRAEGQRAWKKAQVEMNGLLGTDRVMALHALIDDCIAVLEAASPDEPDEPHEPDAGTEGADHE